MASGICPGCEEEGPLKSVRSHIGRCSKFVELFRTDPARAVDPAVEYARVAALRKAARVAAAELSDPAARVSEGRGRPKKKPPLAAPSEEKPALTGSPVSVEYWVVPPNVLSGQ